MAANKEIQAVLDAIDKGLIDFNEAIPQIQEQLYRRILRFQKELVVQGDTVTNTVKNVNLLSNLRQDLEDIILRDTDYLEAVTKLAKLYEKVDMLNFAYFKAIEKRFKPPKVVEAIRKQSVTMMVEGMTEAGLNSALITPIREMITTYTTTGGSYSQMTKELNKYINGTPEIDGALVKYTKLYATDSINQYTATVNQVLASDLGWEWFRFVGSNIKTTRTFCKALTQKQYYHISELPHIIKGNFAEFKEMKGKIYDRTGLPQGMIEDTNTSNFQVYRGGYNCGHQAYPIPKVLVPKNILSKFAN